MGGVELVEGAFDGLPDEEGPVVGVPEFRGDPVVRAGEVGGRGGEAVADEDFIGVGGGGVEVRVAGGKGGLDGFGGGGVVWGEPEAEANGGDIRYSGDGGGLWRDGFLASSGSCEGEGCGEQQEQGCGGH